MNIQPRYIRFFRSSILLLWLLLPFATTLAQRQENLVGTWRWAEGDTSLTLKLNGDGTGALNGDGFKYVVRGDQLLVEDGGGQRSVYVFKFDGSSLTVSGGSLPRALTFTRAASDGGGIFEKNLGARQGRDANDEGRATPAGEWERSDAQQTSRLVLNNDGTGTLNGQPFRWTLARGILNLSEGSTNMSFNASFDSKTLTLKRAGDERALVFSRVGEGANSTTTTRRGDGTPGRDGGGLVGSWRSAAATVQINDNGTLTINGERFRYGVQGDVITLTGAEGSARVRFQLSGNTLVTDFNGDRTVYTRVAEGEAGGGTYGGGANPPELVGKWCYITVVNNSSGGRTTDRCFTLYENGTYEYHGETSTSTQYGGTASQESDSGTWSATSTAITANSRKQGRLVFTLEKRNHPKTGDPMLVLDGDAFVTYHQRPPWQ